MRFLRRRAESAPIKATADVVSPLLLRAGCSPDDIAAADERWVLPGADGSVIAAAIIRADALDSTVLHAFFAVDPVVRNFGTGERMWEHTLARAAARTATRIASWASSQAGYKFLVDHGFAATTTAEDPVSPLDESPRVDGIYTVN